MDSTWAVVSIVQVSARAAITHPPTPPGRVGVAPGGGVGQRRPAGRGEVLLPGVQHPRCEIQGLGCDAGCGHGMGAPGQTADLWLHSCQE